MSSLILSCLYGFFDAAASGLLESISSIMIAYCQVAS